MGSLIAPVGEDGTLQTQTTSGDSLTKKGKDNSTVDSDMFLTLLVAEMQNQDPLEPTSNTEWVSQYATFTQVEKMTEMAESVDMLRANELIGKEVIMKVTSESTGDVSYKQGVVDYVLMEDSKPILVIDDEKYSLSDLDSVVSDEYSKAYDIYSEFAANINALPNIKYADKSYADVITKLYEQYNFEMDDYQKKFMVTYASEELNTLVQWVAKMKDYGVEFKSTEAEEAEEQTSLNDILESFNAKMNAIIDKLNLLTVAADKEQTTQSSGNNDAVNSTENVSSNQTDNTEADKTDSTGDGAESTDSSKTDSTEGTDSSKADSTESTDSSKTDSTENADSSETDSTGNTDSSETDSTGSVENTVVTDDSKDSGSTENRDTENNAAVE